MVQLWRDTLSFEAVPSGWAVNWLVLEQGYAPQFGTEKDLVPADNGNAEILIAPKPGWGRQLRLESGHGLVGVVDVKVDGEVVAQTNMWGVASLSCDRRPESIEVFRGAERIAVLTTSREAEEERSVHDAIWKVSIDESK
jgi:hypothetical protein